MGESIHIKYLAVGPNDLLWGTAANCAGTQHIAPGESYPPANHPSRYLFSEERGRVLNEYQLIYITEGEGWFRSASSPNRVRVSAGTMFLLFPGEWHSYRPLPETGWTEYWLGFIGSIPGEWMKSGFFTPSKPVFKVGLHDDIVRLYQEAIEVAQRQESGFQQRLGGVAGHLMSLLRFYDRQEAFSEVSEKINRAKILISDQYRTITPEEVAKQLCMGYSNFRRVFKEYTGFSPAKYIQDFRLSRIKEALTNTTLPIKEIASEAGMDNYDYFFTSFRHLTGMTPGTYRAMTQGTAISRQSSELPG